MTLDPQKTSLAVLMGGWSQEREVSLVSGSAVSEAARNLGYQVHEIDVDRTLAARLSEVDPDIVFNALHGQFGEDGRVQGLLDMMGCKYTHSGVLASSVAMNKPLAKKVFESEGIRCAAGEVVTWNELVKGEVMDRPFVIKPVDEGSSVGVHLVFKEDNLSMADIKDADGTKQILVERYIAGREIQVGVMGDRAIGAVEVKPLGRFYDYDTKYTDGLAVHETPADLSPSDYDEALSLSLKAHSVLGCKGVSRADLRFSEADGDEGGFYMLEINTQPGMTPLSLVPEIAAHEGISFDELVDWMIRDASCRR